MNLTLWLLGIMVLLFASMGFAASSQGPSTFLNLRDSASDNLSASQERLVQKFMSQGWTRDRAVKEVMKIEAGRAIDSEWE